VAEALDAEKLIYLTDVPGVLTDVADPASLISRLSVARARLLIAEGVIVGGMIPKVEAALDAVQAGVGSSHILDGRIPHVVLLELLTHEGVGTMVTRTAESSP
jgi:acetylglutamate kinase